MDGARETSRRAAAMKTVWSSLQQLSWSPSPDPLASLFWRADSATTRRHQGEYEISDMLVWGMREQVRNIGSKKKRRKARFCARVCRCCTSPNRTHNGAEDASSLDVAAAGRDRGSECEAAGILLRIYLYFKSPPLSVSLH